jgi:hypothetical protein
MVKEHVMNWTPEQVRLVFDKFDSDKSGSISYDEFLVGIRGELNDRRRQLCSASFLLDGSQSLDLLLAHTRKTNLDVLGETKGIRTYCRS